MDPGSPAGGPLQAVTPERVNRRDSIFSSPRMESRDSSVHDKIHQFNNLGVAMQSKQMERKTADAALKRAVLGREEAEAGLKRLREEVRLLQKEVEQGRERERKVGERLEAVMDNYGRAKETHAHTQALWEKEIRRARKENFKSQSAIVKLQEELKSARSNAKALQESLEREKERGKVREQEAFTARYQIVGVQEQLDNALERTKLVEQERDAFKTAAKNEEVARIAAQGRLPLPASHDQTDEFASPEKTKKKNKAGLARRESGRNAPRVSLSTMEVVSSAASEMEIEELGNQVLWERQRADRAQEMIEFLQAECRMRLCSCSKTRNNARKRAEAPQKRRRVSTEGEEEAATIKEETASPHPQRAASRTSLRRSRRSDRISSLRDEHEEQRRGLEPQHEPEPEPEPEPQATLEPEQENEPEVEPEVEQEAAVESEPQRVKSRKQPRRSSTIFCPREGIFRTVSEEEAAAWEAQQRAMVNAEPAIEEEAQEQEDAKQVLPTTEASASPRMYARTPSVEPPTFALLGQERTSLDFLLDAPHEAAQSEAVSVPGLPCIPTVADSECTKPLPAAAATEKTATIQRVRQSLSPAGSPVPRAHSTSTASFTVTTTVPLREDTARCGSSFNERLRTPSHGSSASFDSKDPAMTPTMTREQALAKIRERRGRARSAAQAATMSSGNKAVGERMRTGSRGRAPKRDVSAPTAKATPRFR